MDQNYNYAPNLSKQGHKSKLNIANEQLSLDIFSNLPFNQE